MKPGYEIGGRVLGARPIARKGPSHQQIAEVANRPENLRKQATVDLVAALTHMARTMRAWSGPLAALRSMARGTNATTPELWRTEDHVFGASVSKHSSIHYSLAKLGVALWDGDPGGQWRLVDARLPVESPEHAGDAIAFLGPDTLGARCRFCRIWEREPQATLISHANTGAKVHPQCQDALWRWQDAARRQKAGCQQLPVRK